MDTAAGGVGVGENSPVKSEDTPSCPSRAKTNMGDQLVDDEAAQGEYTNDFDMSNTPSGDVLRGIADERNNLRAVKSDKAEVKKEWWDEQVFGKAPSEEEASAADALRKSLLLRWSRNVMEVCSKYMRDKQGDKWFGTEDRPMKPLRNDGGELTELGKDLEAVSDIMWRAFNSDWFDYPVTEGGSSQLDDNGFSTAVTAVQVEGRLMVRAAARSTAEAQQYQCHPH